MIATEQGSTHIAEPISGTAEVGENEKFFWTLMCSAINKPLTRKKIKEEVSNNAGQGEEASHYCDFDCPSRGNKRTVDVPE